MHQIDGRARQLGDRDSAMDRLALHQARPGASMMARSGATRRQRLFDQRLDHRPVLGMQADKAAIFAAVAHGPKNRAVVHHELSG